MTGFTITDAVDLDSAGVRAVGQIAGTRGDAGAHTWVIRVARGGEAVDLTGMSAVMKVVRADGATVAVPAVIAGNTIEVSFPAPCYAAEGMARVLMRLTDPAARTEGVIAGLILTVTAGETGVTVDSGRVIATLDQMLAELPMIEAAEEARVAAEAGRSSAEALRAAAETGRAARLSALEADRPALDALVTRSAIGKVLNISDAAAGSGMRVTVAGAAGETANLTVCARNLFNEASAPYENLASSFSFSGGKIRYANADGTWRHTQFRCRGVKPGGLYAVSCVNAQGTNIVIGLEQRNAANALVGAAFYLYGNNVKVFAAEPDIAYLNVKFTSTNTNTMCDYSLNLMVEEGSYGGSYEAFAGSTESVGTNTEVQKTAFSPMHVFTDDMARGISASYLAQPALESRVIVAIGDSLTLGSGGAATSFPAKLAELSGRSVINLGVGGEDSLTIAGRQGGIPFVAQPFTIPAAATAVEVTLKSSYMGKSVAPLVLGAAGVNPCYIGGIRGTLSYSGGKYYFTRAVQGAAQVVVSRPTVVITDAMRSCRGDIQVFWAGTNGGWVDTDNVTYNPDVLVSQLQQMAGFSTTGRYLVIGLTALTAAQYANLDARMARAFGRKFLDLRGYMLTYGLADAGITPTAQDNADIAAGVIPSSLRYDQTHFNDAGYAIAGAQVYQRMLELNYIG